MLIKHLIELGIFKLFIKFYFYFFLFLTFVNCKKKEKNIEITPKTSDIILDSVPKYPKYLTKNYVLGKFDYTTNSDFIIVPKKLSNKKIYIRKEVLTSFLKMEKAAKKDGILLKIISGTRNFKHQKRIWNYKWKEKYKNITPLEKAHKILEYSSMPSSSRHHWGTDIDLNSLNNSYFSTDKGSNEYNWLVRNAYKFGFYQVYTSKENGRTGYQEEKWHWSYLPLSTIYLKYYNHYITSNNIIDFEGAEFVHDLKIIEKYVNGINPKLLNLKNINLPDFNTNN